MKNLNPYTIFLSLIFLFSILYYSFRKWEERRRIEQVIKQYPNFSSQMQLIPGWALVWKVVVYPLIGILLCITLFNPHLKEEKLGGENVLTGVDVVFVVDVSLSMYAVDTIPNRLSRFKEFILSLVPELNGNRLGIITFAGTPFLYCPMTSDLAAFSDYVRGLDTDMIPDTGTNLGKAIDKANEILKSKKVYKNRIIVLVTDGEDKSQPSTKIEGSDLIIWGVGTKEGGPIFFRDEVGQISGYVSKDRKLFPSPDEPSLVITRLEEGYLKKLASKNNGTYYNISLDPDAPRQLIEKINTLEKNSNKALKEISKKDGYQFFLAPALLLFLLDVFLVEAIVARRMRILASIPGKR